jgi:gas vesicle protein
MKNLKAILAVSVGFAAGAAVGMLFAPRKGSKTRAKLSNQSKELVNELKEKVKQSEEAIEEVKNEMANTFTNTIDELKKKVVSRN